MKKRSIYIGVSVVVVLFILLPLLLVGLNRFDEALDPRLQVPLLTENFTAEEKEFGQYLISSEVCKTNEWSPEFKKAFEKIQSFGKIPIEVTDWVGLRAATSCLASFRRAKIKEVYFTDWKELLHSHHEQAQEQISRFLNLLVYEFENSRSTYMSMVTLADIKEVLIFLAEQKKQIPRLEIRAFPDLKKALPEDPQAYLDNLAYVQTWTYRNQLEKIQKTQSPADIYGMPGDGRPSWQASFLWNFYQSHSTLNGLYRVNLEQVAQAKACGENQGCREKIQFPEWKWQDVFINYFGKQMIRIGSTELWGAYYKLGLIRKGILDSIAEIEKK